MSTKNQKHQFKHYTKYRFKHIIFFMKLNVICYCKTPLISPSLRKKEKLETQLDETLTTLRF